MYTPECKLMTGNLYTEAEDNNDQKKKVSTADQITSEGNCNEHSHYPAETRPVELDTDLTDVPVVRRMNFPEPAVPRADVVKWEYHPQIKPRDEEKEESQASLKLAQRQSGSSMPQAKLHPLAPSLSPELVETMTLCSGDIDAFPEVTLTCALSSSMTIEPLANPRDSSTSFLSQSLSEATYRNPVSLAAPSSSPAPENIALPLSSSPQWKEDQGHKDTTASALNEVLITCNVDMTLSSSPGDERSSQDEASSDPSYNDMADCTLVEMPGDKEDICIDAEVISSSPPSYSVDVAIEIAESQQPAGSSIANEADTSPSPGVASEEFAFKANLEEKLVEVQSAESHVADTLDSPSSSVPSPDVKSAKFAVEAVLEEPTIEAIEKTAAEAITEEPSAEVVDKEQIACLNAGPNGKVSERETSLQPSEGAIPSTSKPDIPKNIVTSKKRSHSDLDDSYKAPTPKRMTPSLAKRQYAKLSTPFRSPLINKANISDTGASKISMLRPFPLLAENKSSSPLSSIISREMEPTTSSLHSFSERHSSQPGTSRKNMLGTTDKATSQFKSPLLSTTASPSPLGVNASRTIQSLEQKVQTLKRAIKITQEDDEEKLAELVQKWKKAGREAAWDLWQIVREQQSDENTGVAYPGTNAKSISKDSFSSSWGWASNMDSRSSMASGSNWGFDKPLEVDHEDDGEPEDFPSPSKLEEEFYRAIKRNPASKVLPTHRSPCYSGQVETYDDDREEDRHNPTGRSEDEEQEHAPSDSKTLGTMLTQLGIAHETLGWNEDEGDFVED